MQVAREFESPPLRSAATALRNALPKRALRTRVGLAQTTVPGLCQSALPAARRSVNWPVKIQPGAVAPKLLSSFIIIVMVLTFQNSQRFLPGHLQGREKTDNEPSPGRTLSGRFGNRLQLLHLRLSL